MFSRLSSIESMPIFTDEAFDITTGQEVRDGNILSPLQKGYAPIYFWINSLFLSLPLHPLLVSRLASVSYGLASMLILYMVAKTLWTTSAANWSTLLFVVSPMFLFYQRQAILDSSVLFFSLCIAYSAVYYVKHPSKRSACLLAASIVIGLMTKSTIFYTLPIVFLAPFLVKRRRMKIIMDTVRIVGTSLSIVVLVFLLPQFSQVREHHFVLSRFNSWQGLSKEWLAIATYGRVVLSWITSYLTWPVSFIVLASAGRTLLKRDKVGIVLTVWFLSSLLLLLVSSKSPYPRYMISLLIPLYLLAASTIAQSRTFIRITSAVAIIPAAIFCTQILYKLPFAPLPPLERWQYVEGWTSGYGLKEVNEWLLAESTGTHPILYVEDSTYLSARLTMDQEVEVFTFAHMRSFQPPPLEQLPSDGYLLYNYWKPPVSAQMTTLLTYQKSPHDTLSLMKRKGD